MRLRHTLRQLVQRFTGFDIHRYRPTYRYRPAYGMDEWSDMSEILSKESSILAFDVGANLGQTSHKLVQVFPRISIHAFEPSPSVFSELSQALAGYDEVWGHQPAKAVLATPELDITLNNCGVGSQKSEMDFIESTVSEMSSFLEPGPQIWGAVKQSIKVPITRVDDYSVEKHIEHIHLLKIDAQGFDFEVIKGSNRMLAEERIDLVLTEVIFGQLYEGLPRFDALYSCMAQHGYRLTGVYNQSRKRRMLGGHDVRLSVHSQGADARPREGDKGRVGRGDPSGRRIPRRLIQEQYQERKDHFTKITLLVAAIINNLQPIDTD